ncbi:MAG: TRAP transporter substrate-binding protein [Alphaproteobacteria bacterium]
MRTVRSAPITRRKLATFAGATAGLAMAPSILKAQAINLRYANASNEQALTNQFAAAFAKALKERSNGAIDIQLVLNAGSEQSIVESVALGSIDMALSGYSGLAEFDVLYTPALLRDIAHGVRVFNGPVGQKAAAALQRRYRGRFIGGGSAGAFALSMRSRIASWKDVQGKKVRVPPFEAYPAAVRLMGGIPTPVPFNEVYLALQQGVADGLITVLNIMIANKFLEVSKFVVASDFGVGMDKIFMGERSWARLSPAQQKLFTETFVEFQKDWLVDRPMRNKENDLAAWRKANGEDSVLKLDDAELERMMEPLAIKLVTDVYGAGAYEEIKKA